MCVLLQFGWVMAAQWATHPLVHEHGRAEMATPPITGGD